MLPPPKAHELAYGTELITPIGPTTVLADMDFETYSEAGYVWSDEDGKWHSPLGKGKAKKGLELVGLQGYATHPSTEVICLSYDLKDGRGPRLWTPAHPLPFDLFAHLAEGKLVEAFNATFEERIWTHVCVPKYRFPPLPYRQLRCAAAKVRAYCLPPSLAKVGAVLQIEEAKDEGGKALISKLSVPRNPTKLNKSLRNRGLGDLIAMYRYCMQDIRAEAEVSSLTPDLQPQELAFWLADQDCNREGVRVDMPAVDAAIALLDRKYTEAAAEVQQLTSGAVNDITEVSRILAWLEQCGVKASSLEEEALDALLAGELPEVCRRVLQLRAELGSAAVKKFAAIRNTQVNGRIHDQFLYHGARTGRDVGRGVQLQNLPNSGPSTRKCGSCARYFDPKLDACPFCACDAGLGEVQEWSAEAAEGAIAALLEGKLESAYTRPIQALSGSVRGVLIADEGCDFIGSDYSAIEAVVAAALAGEEWQIETFRRKEDIYLATIGRLKGVPVEEYKRYKKETGQHHPDRKVGKVASLASGYGGWVNAWVNFGADKFMTEDEIRSSILAWREANPMIVAAWGGQTDGKPWEGNRYWYGLEGAFLQATTQPNIPVPWRNGVSYTYRSGNVYCQLPSGRYITYHNVVLHPHRKWEGQYAISFEGYNTNVKMGPVGWTRLETYGGRLFENVVQAVARDILANAAINLHTAGHRLRLRVHDELVVSVPEGWGSVEEMESIMNKLPVWAEGWPVRSAGGWRGKRFRK
jgi:DNA polymerase bacteriophage-type